MNFYLLTNKRTGYDCFHQKLIRATTAHRARVLANKHTGDEGEIWEDSDKVLCEICSCKGKEGPIIEYFNNG